MQTKLEEARRERTGVEKDRLRPATGIDEKDYRDMGFTGPSDLKLKEDRHNNSFLTPPLQPVTIFVPCEGRL